MRDVTLLWAFPVARVSGRPLDPAEIAGVELFIRAQGIPDYTPLATVPAPALSFTQRELDFGTYDFGCVVVLNDGGRSAMAEIAVNVIDNSPPLPVANFSATVA